jgi:3-oxoacyl-[acyl-carrier protein] reductase
LKMAEPIVTGAAKLFDVSGLAVLVTGAAHGLGLAIASAFAGAGAKLALADLDEPALRDAARTIGEKTVLLPLDVRDSDAVDDAVRQAASTLGALDVLVNDAAIYPTSSFDAMRPEDFAAVFDVNVGGYARVARAALPFLLASPQARVINMASITYFLGIPPGLSAYITSKGGVIGLTHALARELGPHGITVNAIAPGAFPTRAEEIIEDREAYDQQILESQCIKRRGEVVDIAGAALFLASAAASFITGQTLIVDGGWVFS